MDPLGSHLQHNLQLWSSYACTTGVLCKVTQLQDEGTINTTKVQPVVCRCTWIQDMYIPTWTCTHVHMYTHGVAVVKGKSWPQHYCPKILFFNMTLCMWPIHNTWSSGLHTIIPCLWYLQARQGLNNTHPQRLNTNIWMNEQMPNYDWIIGTISKKFKKVFYGINASEELFSKRI